VASSQEGKVTPISRLSLYLHTFFFKKEHVEVNPRMSKAAFAAVLASSASEIVPPNGMDRVTWIQRLGFTRVSAAIVTDKMGFAATLQEQNMKIWQAIYYPRLVCDLEVGDILGKF
jgi:hypothetical protein